MYDKLLKCNVKLFLVRWNKIANLVRDERFESKCQSKCFQWNKIERFANALNGSVRQSQRD